MRINTNIIKTNHPKGGKRIKSSKSDAKAPEIRHTLLKKGIYLGLEVCSIAAANAIVQVHTSIVKSNMIVPCSWNKAAPEL